MPYLLMLILLLSGCVAHRIGSAIGDYQAGDCPFLFRYVVSHFLP